MDERVLELLSRAVDDDLDPAAAADLERLLEERPALGDELEGLRATRSAVAKLAARMDPPASLDRLMVPLRRAPPPPSQRYRKVRWIAAAAAAVAALGMAYHLGRQMGPTTASLAALKAAGLTPVPEFPEYFKLQPLPTARPGESGSSLGASDRLLAAPDAEPTVGTGEPLFVAGPMPWPGLPLARLELATGRSWFTVAVELPDTCGRPPIRVGVAVRDERIAAAAAVDPESSESAAACAEALVGAGVAGVADGTYGGRLVAPEAPPAH